MSFDLNWFTSIPGMLITGGVLLLLIALIIFIATAGKKGKKSNEGAENVAPGQPQVDPNDGFPQPQVQAEAAPMPTANEQTAMPSMDMTEAVKEMENQVVPEVQPEPAVDMNNPVQGFEPVVDPNPVVMPGPMETVPPVEAVPTPPMEPVVPVQPFAEPVAPVMDIPAVEPVVQNDIAMPTVDVAPVVEQPQVVETTPVAIYGGADPTVSSSLVVDDQGQHTIYGGADPLEGTQAIPIITNPASAIEPVQPVVEPIAPPVVPTVEAVPIMNEQVMPMVEPLAVDPVMPVVEPIVQPIDPVVPQVEPMVQQVETPVMPIVEPLGTTPVVEQPVVPTVETLQ